MAGKLVTFRLKNWNPEHKYIYSSRLPGGRIHIDHMTDALAAMLLGPNGLSNYVERIKIEQKTKRKSQKPATK